MGAHLNCWLSFQKIQIPDILVDFKLINVFEFCHRICLCMKVCILFNFYKVKSGVVETIKRSSQTEDLFRFIKSGSDPVNCDRDLCRFAITPDGTVVADTGTSTQKDSRKHGIPEILDQNDGTYKRIR